MKISKSLFLCFFLSFFFYKSNATALSELTSIYESINGENKPDYELFEKAFIGYIDLKLDGVISAEKEILSIIDFREPSYEKRLLI